MNERTYLGKWKNPRAEEKFRAMLGVLWDRVDAKPTLVEVDTSFGTTAVNRWAGDGAPIVFLHGMTDTSIRWVDYADALSGHDVYAIDTMGDVGLSRQEVGWRTSADYSTWLIETMDGLGLDNAHLVGASLGGLIALQTAGLHPDRARSVTLYDPIGVVDLKLSRFMAIGAYSAVAILSPAPVREAIAHRLQAPHLFEKETSRPFMHSQLNHPPKVPPIKPLDDEVLAAVTAPVTLLAGEKSGVFDTAAMLERATTLLPECRFELLTGASHFMTDTNFDECLAALRSTLTSHPADS